MAAPQKNTVAISRSQKTKFPYCVNIVEGNHADGQREMPFSQIIIIVNNTYLKAFSFKTENSRDIKMAHIIKL